MYAFWSYTLFDSSWSSQIEIDSSVFFPDYQNFKGYSKITLFGRLATLASHSSRHSYYETSPKLQNYRSYLDLDGQRPFGFDLNKAPLRESGLVRMY